jgi:hypothetical protein
MEPESGCSNPAIMRSVVVLPHPEGPSSEKNSPGPMSRSIPSTATSSPNVLVRPASDTAPVVIAPVVGGPVVTWSGVIERLVW